MYGIKITRRNGTMRQTWEGCLVGEWGGADPKPYVATSIGEAEAKAATLQPNADKYGWDVRYLACPLPHVSSREV